MPRIPTLGFHLQNNLANHGYQQYAELHLTIQQLGIYNTPTLCRFQWQAGMLNDRPASDGYTEWYAGRMHVECEAYDLVDTLRRVQRIARIVSETHFQRRPLALVRALEAAGIVPCEYDNVHSTCVPIEDLTMAPKASWRDDYERTGEPHCQHHVVAESFEEAQRLMLKEYGMNVSKDDGAAMRRWVDAGKPVVRMFTGAAARPCVLEVIGGTTEVQEASKELLQA